MPSQRRLLAAVGMAGANAEDLARSLGWTLHAFGRGLWSLCRWGAARRAVLVYPERMGQPVQGLVYLSLATPDLSAMEAFEAWCRAEPEISQAVMIAGGRDYALWTWHRDERTADAWRRALELRPEVGRCEMRLVRVLFGHALHGAPVFSG